MKPFVLKGATDQTVYLFVPDSSSTTGGGLTGLVYNSASLVASYVRPLATRTAITLATQTVTGAHSDGGFVEIDATNMPGIYRLDLPDAAVASGVNSVVIQLKGATNMAPVNLEIPLVAVNLQDAVRLGLTALPNAAADAAGGLPISDAGGLDLDAILADTADMQPKLGTPAGASVSADVAAIKSDTAAILVDTADIQPKIGTPAVDVSADIAAVKAQTAAIETDTQDLQAQVGTAGAGLTAIGDTRIANLDGTVSSRATAAALATAQADLDTLTGTDGATLATTQANYAPAKAGDAMALTSGERTTLAAAIWNALTSGMSTVGSIGKKLADWTILAAADVWAAGTRTLTAGTNIALAKGTGVTGFTDLDAAGVRAAVGLAAADLDTQLAALPTAAENATAALTTAMTESYSTASGTKTLSQALYEIFALVGEFSVSGTTLTIKKLDGTDAGTFTLDSASAPTSITRAT